MQIDEISETTRNYTIRFKDDKYSFDTVDVEIDAELLNPENPIFTHCKVSLNTQKYRTIKEHIEYFNTVCRGLRELRYLLKEQKYSNPILLNVNKDKEKQA